MRSLHWPFFDLRIRTGRLELRPPTDDDLAELAQIAAHGIHDPQTMPFAVPWTDEPPGALERGFLQYHWTQRGALCPTRWNLEFAVWVDDRLVGAQGILAESFATSLAVGTGSWLGRSFQRQGIGREMRSAVLEFAFVGLCAEVATSSAFSDNEASRKVSLGLGYRFDGADTKSPRGVPKEHHRFRIDRATWLSRPDRPTITLEGLGPCLPLLGAPRQGHDE